MTKRYEQGKSDTGRQFHEKLCIAEDETKEKIWKWVYKNKFRLNQFKDITADVEVVDVDELAQFMRGDKEKKYNDR